MITSIDVDYQWNIAGRTNIGVQRDSRSRASNRGGYAGDIMRMQGMAAVLTIGLKVLSPVTAAQKPTAQWVGSWQYVVMPPPPGEAAPALLGPFAASPVTPLAVPGAAALTPAVGG